jgi:polar amino acid transport system substrate-binding protein
MSLFVGITWLGATAKSSADCIKTVRWSDDRPYTWRDEAGELRGIYIDFAHELMRRLECVPQFVEMPWARALVELEAGRLDLLFGAFADGNRERYAHFSIPINRSPNLLFISTTAAQKTNIKELADLEGTNFRLGVQIGVNYNGTFEKFQNNTTFTKQLVKISNRQNGWKMMAADRLDGLIADEMTALMELQKLDLLHVIHKSTVEISNQAAAVAFSKKSVPTKFVLQFNMALENMKADGSYKALLTRYLPCNINTERLGCN